MKVTGIRKNHYTIWIINEALERNIASAIVYRGLEGVNSERKLHTIKLVTLSIDLPIVIEVIDKENIINDFLKAIEHAIGNGVVTIEKAKVKFYKKIIKKHQMRRNEP